jgi:hypothetical protein
VRVLHPCALLADTGRVGRFRQAACALPFGTKKLVAVNAAQSEVDAESTETRVFESGDPEETQVGSRTAQWHSDCRVNDTSR